MIMLVAMNILHNNSAVSVEQCIGRLTLSVENQYCLSASILWSVYCRERPILGNSYNSYQSS